jgi:hypothetical protein
VYCQAMTDVQETVRVPTYEPPVITELGLVRELTLCPPACYKKSPKGDHYGYGHEFCTSA